MKMYPFTQRLAKAQRIAKGNAENPDHFFRTNCAAGHEGLLSTDLFFAQDFFRPLYSVR